jgi:hypothetical protein
MSRRRRQPKIQPRIFRPALTMPESVPVIILEPMRGR